MKIHPTLQLFPESDSVQVSLMTSMVEAGLLNSTIVVSTNPETGEKFLVDGRSRLAILGSKVREKSVPWGDASEVCYQLNASAKPITTLQKACLHYEIWGEQQNRSETVWPENMLKHVAFVRRHSESIFQMLKSGRIASLQAAYEMAKPAPKPDPDDEPDDDSDDPKPPPMPQTSEADLKKSLDHLDKAKKFYKRASRRPTENRELHDEYLDRIHMLLDGFKTDPF